MTPAGDGRGGRARNAGAPGEWCGLLEDGSLAISAGADVLEVIGPWLPRIPPVGAGNAAALIHVDTGPTLVALPTGPPDMEMLDVGGWIRGDREEVVLAHAHGRLEGRVALAAHRAEVRLRAGDDAPAVAEVSSALTMAAALLVGRLGRALAHAGAVVPPGGGAWLLAGGSFSGKTTTCINLIQAGWGWLSDDHVVLQRAGEGVRAEAWPRRFNLDHGYAGGTSTGIRSRVDPEGFGPGPWLRAAPVAGLLFPRVEAELPTAVSPVHPAQALGLLLRNSPWILADRGAAPAVLGLLERAARLPAFELRLGRDTYRDANRLQMRLTSTLDASTDTSTRTSA